MITKLVLALLTIVSLTASAKPISLMTYNVENLFDTQHDEGKRDFTYLPKKIKDASSKIKKYCKGLSNSYYRWTCLNLDWSEKVLDAKIHNIAKVISLYSKKKTDGPDILLLQEVENKKSLTLLAEKLGYEHISLIEGPDSRGIDVAVLSQYPIIEETIHRLDLKPHSQRQTRPILDVKIKIGSKVLNVFVNHWPSQGNDDKTRLVASKVLKKLALNSKKDLVVAAGDFNTSDNDVINGIKTNILPHFVDVETKGRDSGQVPVAGTHWYKGKWESLDRIFVRKDHRQAIDYSSFEIVYHPFMLKKLKGASGKNNLAIELVPNRFNAKSRTGFSDHLPVVINLNI